MTCALIGTNRKLAAYNYTAYWQNLNKAWVRAGRYKRSLRRYPQCQSRTCYQECGCRLISMKFKLLSTNTSTDFYAPKCHTQGIQCLPILLNCYSNKYIFRKVRNTCCWFQCKKATEQFWRPVLLVLCIPHLIFFFFFTQLFTLSCWGDFALDIVVTFHLCPFALLKTIIVHG